MAFVALSRFRNSQSIKCLIWNLSTLCFSIRSNFLQNSTTSTLNVNIFNWNIGYVVVTRWRCLLNLNTLKISQFERNPFYELSRFTAKSSNLIQTRPAPRGYLAMADHTNRELKLADWQPKVSHKSLHFLLLYLRLLSETSFSLSGGTVYPPPFFFSPAICSLFIFFSACSCALLSRPASDL